MWILYKCMHSLVYVGVCVGVCVCVTDELFMCIEDISGCVLYVNPIAPATLSTAQAAPLSQKQHKLWEPSEKSSLNDGSVSPNLYRRWKEVSFYIKSHLFSPEKPTFQLKSHFFIGTRRVLKFRSGFSLLYMCCFHKKVSKLRPIIFFWTCIWGINDRRLE